MKPYQLVVFDWDGTLMDSTGHIVYCMQQAIEKLELAPLTDGQISHIIGLGLNEAVQTLYPGSSAALVQALANQYREIWLNHPYESPLFANARELLLQLAEQNYFLAVATGKSRRGLDKVLTATGLADIFHATRCADESRSKPNPEMLHDIFDRLGVYAKDTLMIGDTEFDLKMAHNAGADSLGISHGAHPTEQLLACQPKALVADLFEAEHWLHSLSC